MQQSHFHESHGGGGNAHQHGVIDPKMVTSERGKQAVKISFMALMITALLQVSGEAFHRIEDHKHDDRRHSHA